MRFPMEPVTKPPLAYLLFRVISLGLGVILLLVPLLPDMDHPERNAWDKLPDFSVMIVCGLAMVVPFRASCSNLFFWPRLILLLVPSGAALVGIVIMVSELGTLDYTRFIGGWGALLLLPIVCIVFVVTLIPPVTLWWNRKLTFAGKREGLW